MKTLINICCICGKAFGSRVLNAHENGTLISHGICSRDCLAKEYGQEFLDEIGYDTEKEPTQ